MPDLSSIELLGVGAAAGALIVCFLVWLRRRAARARRKAVQRVERMVVRGGRSAMRVAAKVREEGIGAAFRDPIGALEVWAETEHPPLPGTHKDGTVTILFSDIENSTALNEELGDNGWMKVLGAHDSLVRKRVEANEGNVVKSQGDGFMVAFPDPEPAVRCAAEIQRGLESGPRVLRKHEIKVRIGIHSGKAVAREGDLYGRNVALAARVANQADGGQILVSETVEQAASDADGLSVDRGRKVELKGLGRHRVVEVSWRD